MANSLPRLYAARDPQALEPHYSAHVSAMTEEGLHAKADIAAELAFRDKDIALLWAENTALKSVLATLLTLDAERPIDPLYWRRHWDKAREEANALLGIRSQEKPAVQP